MSVELSVVVANAVAVPSRVEPATAALARELGDTGSEVVWVDRAGLMPDAPIGAFVSVSAPADSSRGDLYALGLARARARIVAFTDSTTVLGPGWRRALAAAFESGACLVGGPVLPAVDGSIRSWAGFLTEYAPHAVPPFTSATGDVAGNNVAYAAAVLDEFRGAPFWKTSVNRRLAARGIAPTIAEGMRVEVRKRYGWRALLGDRAGHGRQYAAARANGWAAGRRIARAAATPLLPAVLCARLARTAGGDRLLRRGLWRAAPAVLAAQIAWSVGEGVGYLAGDGHRKGLL